MKKIYLPFYFFKQQPYRIAFIAFVFFIVGLKGFSQATYTWNQTGTADWTVDANWTPSRTTPAPNDILQFNSGVITTPINIPTQIIGQLLVTGNTTVNLQGAAAGTVLTVSGLTGDDLSVTINATLNINAATNTTTLFLDAGATGVITGHMTLSAAAHKLNAADANAIIFNAPALFTQEAGCSGSVFTTGGTPNVIVFNTGTTFDQKDGANPFGLTQPDSKVVFNTGSTFAFKVPSGTPAFSGRTYANFDFWGSGAAATVIGSSAVSINSFRVVSGTINVNMTGTPGHSIKGNINVLGGATLNFNPATAGTISLNGTTGQSITNSGTLIFGANQGITINDPGGVTLNNDIILNDLLTFNSGVITAPNPVVLTLSNTASVAGASNASYVNGKVQKIGNTPFVFPVGKPAFSGFVGGYVPIEIYNPINATATDSYTAEYLRLNDGNLTAPGLATYSARDHWTLIRSVTNPAATVGVTLNWTTESSDNGSPLFITSLPSLVVTRKTMADWSAYGPTTLALGTVIAGTVTDPSVSNFEEFAIGSINFANPLPAIVNYITSVKQSGIHLLNWKVSCTNNNEVTMILERAGADKKFSLLTSINASSVRCQQPFDYSDINPVNGINYYRLKLITSAGKETYSNNIAIINGNTGFDIISLMPNIITTTAQLNIAAAKKTKLNITIADVTGRTITKQQYNLVTGSNRFDVNVAQLSAGVYYITGVTAEGDIKTLRFVKQ